MATQKQYVVQKTYYVTPKQVKLVGKLANKLKVSESQVVRGMKDAYPYDHWLEILSTKK